MSQYGTIGVFRQSLYNLLKQTNNLKHFFYRFKFFHRPHPTVFVVDDYAPVRNSLARLLRAAGFAVAGFTKAGFALAFSIEGTHMILTHSKWSHG